MRLSRNKVRFRKRISILNAVTPSSSLKWCGNAGHPALLIFLLQFVLLFFGAVVNGEVIGGSAVSSVSSSVNIFTCFSNLGAFVVIYSALPHFATAKSIRNGKEVEDEEDFLVSNSTLSSTVPPPVSSNQSLSSSSPGGDSNSNSTLFSSRTLPLSDEDDMASTTLTPSAEMEMSLDSSSEERKRKTERTKGMNRLKRQMGMAAEIALIAPALQTMGCIPKFFCGLNSKPPTHESSALNDLAYLIKFAMLDDDDADLDDPLFAAGKPENNRGKDGIIKVKEDLILENLAEEEMIQDDPANLPFVWKDMEHRIKTKTKPGSKFRIEDVMDEIIVEPEQTAVGSLFTGIKSVLRIGRSVDHVLSRAEGEGNETSQATARSGRGGRDRLKNPSDQLLRRSGLRWRQQSKQRPFWTTPQFRQDMELAERIGKVDQDEGKCSTTFNVCPYTVHEMMDIVHGGYKKKQERKKKKKPQWYINAQGPPKDSSEETVEKPVRDPDNLITTTTEKTQWYPSDPENQLYYSIFPHKAIEKGMTTVRTTTRRPSVAVNTDEEGDPETIYDIGPRPPKRNHRRPPLDIQGHVEYENENNDDEGSFERNRPEHLDVMISNNRPLRQPPQKTSWWSFGSGGNKRPQHQRPHGHAPGRRPPGMGGAHHHRPTEFDGGMSKEDNDDLGDSSEENGKRRKNKNKKGGSTSDSGEDGSSEEKNSRDKVMHPQPDPPPTTPATPVTLPPELQSGNPNIQILGIHLIQNGGDLAPTGIPQQMQSLQPLQPFFQDTNLKQAPIALPRPKYKIQRERKQKKRRRVSQDPLSSGVFGTQQQQTPPQEQPQSDALKPTEKDKSNEASDEEEDEESQENSSEEKATKDEQSPPPSSPPHRPQGPTVNVILHGRPSEELREPPKQHEHKGPHPGDGQPQSSASAEDDLDNSDEDNRNSNSAGVEPSSDEISREMAKLPQPARPPFRMNGSSEYTYSDEHDGRPPGSMRPIHYSYFQNQPNEHNSGPHAAPPPPTQPGQQQDQPPQSTTQKYSTGFLSFLFGKDKKQKRPPGSMENRPPKHHQEQHPPPNYSDEDPADDDDDDSSEERDTSPKQTFTGPEGKYEVGHLGNRPPPKSFTPDFKPPQKPVRPYRGSTSMEDSDEKRGRSTPAPPTTLETTTVSTRPVILIGNPFKTFIPLPATPPHRIPTQPTQEPVVVTKTTPKESSEDDEPESDEKGSDESKEDDDDNSSEETTDKKVSKRKQTADPNKVGNPAKVVVVPLPPIANYHSPEPSSTTTRPTVSKSSTKHRNDHGDKSDEKQDDDSNQTKEDDSAEETKTSKELRSDEDSDENKSSEEKKNKKQSPPPPPKRKQEDDELEHPASRFPPQQQIVGDIAAVGELLGRPEGENDDDEPYGGIDDIPAAPPLALQGFAPSLEILVPTKPTPPLQAPPGVSLQQFYQGNNPLAGGGPGGGPGGISPPGPHNQQLGPVNPTSLLGLSQQAGPNNNNGFNPGGGPPARDPGSDQSQQGIRNPLGQTSNRGPGNRRPGQQGQQGQHNNRQPSQGNRRQPQQGNNQQGKEDSSEENSSEEKEGQSSEEKESKGNEGGFDEAIESLGQNENEEDDDAEEKDEPKEPPPPPPVFTSALQKQELQKFKPFLPRPVTPQPTLYFRPKPGRREPILKNQLQPTQLLQLQHQQINPPPMKKPPAHQHHQFVLPMRPSAAANLRPLGSQHHQKPSSSNSFSVSHLLRPLMPMPVAHRKPLDQKVVDWIRETYGIPDLNGNNNPHGHHPHDPNRSGLSSEVGGGSNVKNQKTTSTTKPPSRSSSKKADKPKREKSKGKASSKRKTTTVKPKIRGSSERRHSGEVTSFTTSTTTTTTTTTTKAPETSVTPSTTTTTTAKVEEKKPTTTTAVPSSTKKIPPDYITEEQEAKMAQALFGSSEEEPEEEEEEEKDSDEDEDDKAAKTKYKRKYKTKVGGTNLVITVKSVVGKNKTKSSSSAEKMGKPSAGKLSFSSAERKKHSESTLREKVKISSKETSKFSSGEKTKKKHSSTKSSSAEQQEKRKNSSSESTKKIATTTINPKFVLGLRSTPKSKLRPIKLPPIYGKLPRRNG